MANITKTIAQYKKKNMELESWLSITVDYDPKENTVEGIVEISTYNFDSRTTTDITAIMAEQFAGQLDSMIDSIDWREEYATYMAERRIAV